jgi:hypothetical protein
MIRIFEVNKGSMTTKLTLSIEKDTIEKARLLSSKTGRSISKMVEEYLNLLVMKGESEGSAVERLSGILKGKATEDIDWKSIKADYLNKKYDL